MTAAPRSVMNLIDGEPREAGNGLWLDDYAPATGAVCARVPDSSGADVGEAVAAADRAAENWAAVPVSERAAVLERMADGVVARADELAAMESTDTGKLLSLARNVDMNRAAANLRFFAGAIRHVAGRSHDMGAAGFNYSLRQPLGVVACITPWNLPLYLLTWKVAPALAAGNTVVAKPSEMTPLTAEALGAIALEAGLPPGVFNIVHGRGAGAGQALVDHPEVRAISFTGGTTTGIRVAEAAARRLVKTSLELGGKNPAVVFADADPERTVDGLVRACYTHQGQICLCAERLLVDSSIAGELFERLSERIRAMRIGDPDDPENQQGALISAEHLDKVTGFLDTAREEGGEIVGGERIRPEGRCRDGWFMRPALVRGLDADSRVVRDEVFGPVVCLQTFDDPDEAVEMANATRYGLAATVWTRDLDRALVTARRLEAGIIWINDWLVRDLRTPFGGMKDSGIGREGGFNSLEFFSEIKNICVKHETKS